MEKNFSAGEILLYQTEDGTTQLEVHLQDETIWLSQVQIASLFQRTRQNISLHINNIFKENELSPGATIKEYLIVGSESGRQVERMQTFYNLTYLTAEFEAQRKKSIPLSHVLNGVPKS